MIGSLQAKNCRLASSITMPEFLIQIHSAGKSATKAWPPALKQKNNKRRAEQVLMELLDTNAYLKQPPKQLNANVDPHIKLTCYLDR